MGDRLQMRAERLDVPAVHVGLVGLQDVPRLLDEAGERRAADADRSRSAFSLRRACSARIAVSSCAGGGKRTEETRERGQLLIGCARQVDRDRTTADAAVLVAWVGLP